MKIIFFWGLLFFCTHSIAQTGAGDKEKMIAALKQSGLLRQEGNTLIYKVNRAGDTAQAKLLYGNLFNGSAYTMKFEVDGKYRTAPVNKTPKSVLPNATVNTNSNQTNNTVSASSGCCCSNMKAFPANAAVMVRKANALFVDEIWTVPQGITTIKIEAWSAGGNGWSEYIDTDPAANSSTFALKGMGGGGGAYVLITLPVTAGDILKMHIPFGGSNATLTLQLNDRTTGGLNLESGHNGKEVSGTDEHNGRGGKLGLYSGVFTGNVFSVAGGDGEASFISANYDNRTEHSSGVFISNIDYDRFNPFYGKGGDAPRGGSGGYGLKQRKQLIMESELAGYISATDGKTPGGGGGAGMDNARQVKLSSGKGADGVVIIYY